MAPSAIAAGQNRLVFFAIGVFSSGSDSGKFGGSRPIVGTFTGALKQDDANDPIREKYGTGDPPRQAATRRKPVWTGHVAAATLYFDSSEGHSMKPQQTATKPIRSAEDLLARLESHPASAAEIEGMDPWQRWALRHAMPALLGPVLDEWETAALECIVRYSDESGRLPQDWLFDGGPGDDPRLRLSCLSSNARKQRITRFIDSVHKAGRQLGLAWKVQRAADCSKTISTAYTAAYGFTLPRP